MQIRERGHGRARTPRRGPPLIERHCRTQSSRLPQLPGARPSELPARVRREVFGEAGRRLCVQRVEGERRLAAPRDAGNDRQTTGGNVDVKPTKVVGSHATKLDRIWRQRWKSIHHALIRCRIQLAAQCPAGQRIRAIELQRGPRGHDLPTSRPASWPQLDEPIRSTQHIQIMLYDDDAVPLLHEGMQSVQQLRDIGAM
jgi:hypothetical protein